MTPAVARGMGRACRTRATAWISSRPCPRSLRAVWTNVRLTRSTVHGNRQFGTAYSLAGRPSVGYPCADTQVSDLRRFSSSWRRRRIREGHARGSTPPEPGGDVNCSRPGRHGRRGRLRQGSTPSGCCPWTAHCTLPAVEQQRSAISSASRPDVDGTTAGTDGCCRSSRRNWNESRPPFRLWG